MERLAIWLLPAEPEALALRDAIVKLAADLGHVAFEPHLTLLSGPPTPDARAILKATASRHPPFALHPIGVRRGETFKTSAALGLAPSAPLARLCLDLSEKFGWPARAGEPHVSLAYGAATKPVPVAALDVRFKHPVVFNALTTLRYESPIDSQEKVANWRVGPPFALRGA